MGMGEVRHGGIKTAHAIQAAIQRPQASMSALSLLVWECV